MPTATAPAPRTPPTIDITPSTELATIPGNPVMNELQDDLIARVRAGFPIIWIITDEYARGTLTTEAALKELNRRQTDDNKLEICYWDLRTGLVKREDGLRLAPPPRQDDSSTKQLEMICNLSPKDSVTIIVGLHQLLATFASPAALAYIHAYILQMTCPAATLSQRYVPPAPGGSLPGVVVQPSAGRNGMPVVTPRAGAGAPGATPAAPAPVTQENAQVDSISTLTATDSNRRLIIVGPKPDPSILPTDVTAYIEFLEMPRPTPQDFAREMESLLTDGENNKIVPYTEEDVEKASHELRGLTRYQATNATMLTMVKDRGLNHKTLRNQVKSIMETHPAISIPDYTEKWEELFGYDALKDGLDLLLGDNELSLEEALKLIPKGVMITGMPGCGKSHLAKAAGAKYGRRTIFVNLGLVFGQYVGQSERQMSDLLKALDACSQSIIYIDEFEQAVSGMGGGGSKGDSGVSDRLANQFLTWLNDRVSDNFIIASSNDLTKIPAQFLRTGRWDAIFFVDTPRPPVRKEIINLYAGKINLAMDEKLVQDMVEMTNDWAGVELKYLVEFTYRFFRRDKDMSKAFEKARRFVKPLKDQRPERFHAIREMGKEIGIPADIDDKVMEVPPSKSTTKRGNRALDTLTLPASGH